MRKSSQVLIFIDVAKALQAGIKFYLSANGVVLTPGNAKGYLKPKFFQRVETLGRKPIPDMLDESELPDSSSDEKVPDGASLPAQSTEQPLNDAVTEKRKDTEESIS